ELRYRRQSIDERFREPACQIAERFLTALIAEIQHRHPAWIRSAERGGRSAVSLETVPCGIATGAEHGRESDAQSSELPGRHPPTRPGCRSCRNQRLLRFRMAQR